MTLLDPILENTHKGYPHQAPAMPLSHVGTQGWSLYADDLPLPLAVLRQSPLQHNLQWMQQLANDAGIAFAPHGKTTMSPQLFRQQLDAGAWGLTLANVQQVRIALAAGARRIIIANQVFQAGDLAQISQWQAQDPSLRIMFLLDSHEQLALITESAPSQSSPFEVLLEVGETRTGCRTHEQALALAEAARLSPKVRLVGVECYEGLTASGDSAADSARTAALLARLQQVVLAVHQAGGFECEEIIVSSGGSALFDLVLAPMRINLDRSVLGVLRSGCYLTHDHGFYHRLVEKANKRLGCHHGLQPALEVWAHVQSRPEPDLAILAVGKRDISYDLALPQPVAYSPRGSRARLAAAASWQLTGLNDQHAYLQLGADSPDLAVGDRVMLGISHPCTTFDKWRWLPVINDDALVVDAVSTRF